MTTGTKGGGGSPESSALIFANDILAFLVEKRESRAIAVPTWVCHHGDPSQNPLFLRLSPKPTTPESNPNRTRIKLEIVRLRLDCELFGLCRTGGAVGSVGLWAPGTRPHGRVLWAAGWGAAPRNITCGFRTGAPTPGALPQRLAALRLR